MSVLPDPSFLRIPAAVSHSTSNSNNSTNNVVASHSSSSSNIAGWESQGIAESVLRRGNASKPMVPSRIALSPIKKITLGSVYPIIGSTSNGVHHTTSTSRSNHTHSSDRGGGGGGSMRSSHNHNPPNIGSAEEDWLPRGIHQSVFDQNAPPLLSSHYGKSNPDNHQHHSSSSSTTTSPHLSHERRTTHLDYPTPGAATRISRFPNGHRSRFAKGGGVRPLGVGLGGRRRGGLLTDQQRRKRLARRSQRRSKVLHHHRHKSRKKRRKIPSFLKSLQCQNDLNGGKMTTTAGPASKKGKKRKEEERKRRTAARRRREPTRRRKRHTTSSLPRKRRIKRDETILTTNGHDNVVHRIPGARPRRGEGRRRRYHSEERDSCSSVSSSSSLGSSSSRGRHHHQHHRHTKRAPRHRHHHRRRFSTSSLSSSFSSFSSSSRLSEEEEEEEREEDEKFFYPSTSGKRGRRGGKQRSIKRRRGERKKDESFAIFVKKQTRKRTEKRNESEQEEEEEEEGPEEAKEEEEEEEGSQDSAPSLHPFTSPLASSSSFSPVLAREAVMRPHFVFSEEPSLHEQHSNNSASSPTQMMMKRKRKRRRGIDTLLPPAGGGEEEEDGIFGSSSIVKSDKEKGQAQPIILRESQFLRPAPFPTSVKPGERYPSPFSSSSSPSSSFDESKRLPLLIPIQEEDDKGGGGGGILTRATAIPQSNLYREKKTSRNARPPAPQERRKRRGKGKMEDGHPVEGGRKAYKNNDGSDEKNGECGNGAGGGVSSSASSPPPYLVRASTRAPWEEMSRDEEGKGKEEGNREDAEAPNIALEKDPSLSFLTGKQKHGGRDQEPSLSSARITVGRRRKRRSERTDTTPPTGSTSLHMNSAGHVSAGPESFCMSSGSGSSHSRQSGGEGGAKKEKYLDSLPPLPHNDRLVFRSDVTPLEVKKLNEELHSGKALTKLLRKKRREAYIQHEKKEKEWEEKEREERKKAEKEEKEKKKKSRMASPSFPADAFLRSPAEIDSKLLLLHRKRKETEDLLLASALAPPSSPMLPSCSALSSSSLPPPPPYSSSSPGLMAELLKGQKRLEEGEDTRSDASPSPVTTPTSTTSGNRTRRHPPSLSPRRSGSSCQRNQKDTCMQIPTSPLSSSLLSKLLPRSSTALPFHTTSTQSPASLPPSRTALPPSVFHHHHLSLRSEEKSHLDKISLSISGRCSQSSGGGSSHHSSSSNNTEGGITSSEQSNHSSGGPPHCAPPHPTATVTSERPPRPTFRPLIHNNNNNNNNNNDGSGGGYVIHQTTNHYYFSTPPHYFDDLKEKILAKAETDSTSVHPIPVHMSPSTSHPLPCFSFSSMPLSPPLLPSSPMTPLSPTLRTPEVMRGPSTEAEVVGWRRTDHLPLSLPSPLPQSQPPPPEIVAVKREREKTMDKVWTSLGSSPLTPPVRSLMPLTPLGQKAGGGGEGERRKEDEEKKECAPPVVSEAHWSNSGLLQPHTIVVRPPRHSIIFPSSTSAVSAPKTKREEMGEEREKIEREAANAFFRSPPFLPSSPYRYTSSSLSSCAEDYGRPSSRIVCRRPPAPGPLPSLPLLQYDYYRNCANNNYYDNNKNSTASTTTSGTNTKSGDGGTGGGGGVGMGGLAGLPSPPPSVVPLPPLLPLEAKTAETPLAVERTMVDALPITAIPMPVPPPLASSSSASALLSCTKRVAVDPHGPISLPCLPILPIRPMYRRKDEGVHTKQRRDEEQHERNHFISPLLTRTSDQNEKDKGEHLIRGFSETASFPFSPPSSSSLSGGGGGGGEVPSAGGSFSCFTFPVAHEERTPPTAAVSPFSSSFSSLFFSSSPGLPPPPLLSSLLSASAGFGVVISESVSSPSSSFVSLSRSSSCVSQRHHRRDGGGGGAPSRCGISGRGRETTVEAARLRTRQESADVVAGSEGEWERDGGDGMCGNMIRTTALSNMRTRTREEEEKEKTSERMRKHHSFLQFCDVLADVEEKNTTSTAHRTKGEDGEEKKEEVKLKEKVKGQSVKEAENDNHDKEEYKYEEKERKKAFSVKTEGGNAAVVEEDKTRIGGLSPPGNDAQGETRGRTSENDAFSLVGDAVLPARGNETTLKEEEEKAMDLFGETTKSKNAETWKEGRELKAPPSSCERYAEAVNANDRKEEENGCGHEKETGDDLDKHHQKDYPDHPHPLQPFEPFFSSSPSPISPSSTTPLLPPPCSRRSRSTSGPGVPAEVGVVGEYSSRHRLPCLLGEILGDLALEKPPEATEWMERWLTGFAVGEWGGGEGDDHRGSKGEGSPAPALLSSPPPPPSSSLSLLSSSPFPTSATKVIRTTSSFTSSTALPTGTISSTTTADQQ